MNTHESTGDTEGGSLPRLVSTRRGIPGRIEQDVYDFTASMMSKYKHTHVKGDRLRGLIAIALGDALRHGRKEC